MEDDSIYERGHGELPEDKHTLRSHCRQAHSKEQRQKRVEMYTGRFRSGSLESSDFIPGIVFLLASRLHALIKLDFQY